MHIGFNRANCICAAFCIASIAMAAEIPTFKPEKGFVPDEKTAISVAEAVLKPIYGDEHIRGEEPFTATLKGDTWTVEGTLPPQFLNGGVAIIRLSRTDGRILYMMHGK